MTVMTPEQAAAVLGLNVAEVRKIAASIGGSVETSPLWNADELADRRANGAARRESESRDLLAQALARRGPAQDLS